MSLFSRIFGAPKPTPSARIEVTGRPATFSAFSGDPYSNDVFRGGVDAIARVFAKSCLQPVCEFSDGSKANVDERLARLLQIQPNPLMSGYDLLYLLTTHLFVTNNAFAYLQRDHGQIVAVWPLHVTNCELVQGKAGRTLCAMTFANGRTTILDYQDVVHLRRHLNSGDVLGDSNGAINSAVSLADAMNKGIENSIRTAGNFRGIVKFSGALGESKLAAYKKAFEWEQLQPENSGGVIITDSAVEYIPLNESAPTINAEDVAETKRKIYDYLGISEGIVNSSFDDNVFGAFDESVVEALALQSALEWTRKVYSPSQIARGRRIEVNTARIRYISTQNRANLIKYATPMGALSINETRDLLGLAPVEGGDMFIRSLNYVDAAIANEYQLFNSGHGGIKAMNLPEGADNAED